MGDTTNTVTAQAESASGGTSPNVAVQPAQANEAPAAESQDQGIQADPNSMTPEARFEALLDQTNRKWQGVLDKATSRLEKEIEALKGRVPQQPAAPQVTPQEAAQAGFTEAEFEAAVQSGNTFDFLNRLAERKAQDIASKTVDTRLQEMERQRAWDQQLDAYDAALQSAQTKGVLTDAQRQRAEQYTVEYTQRFGHLPDMQDAILHGRGLTKDMVFQAIINGLNAAPAQAPTKPATPMLGGDGNGVPDVKAPSKYESGSIKTLW